MDINDFGKKEEALFGSSSEKVSVPQELENREHSSGTDEESFNLTEKAEEAVERSDEEKPEEISWEWERAMGGDAYPTVRGVLQGHEISIGRNANKFYGVLDGAHISDDVAEKIYRKLLEKKLVATHAQRYNVKLPEHIVPSRQEGGSLQEASQDASDQRQVNKILAKILLK